MVLIYEDSEISVKKQRKNEFIIFIKNWDGDYNKFWDNFPVSLMNVIKIGGKPSETQELTIKADKMTMLSDLIKHKKTLDYIDCLALLTDVGNQIQSLEMFNMGIPFLKPSDILVVDNKHYFIINTSRILSVSNKKLTINTPYKRTRFFTPELQDLTGIPAQISWKSGYYSLASLVLTCLTGEFLLGNKSSAGEILDKLYATKLYWALMRCLEPEPRDRYYLII
jgi:hypothetical protein|tara:strand:+ start:503 stop:1174 length:672 start_codon:yes stop_codon:yes gene_type:complete